MHQVLLKVLGQLPVLLVQSQATVGHKAVARNIREVWDLQIMLLLYQCNLCRLNSSLKANLVIHQSQKQAAMVNHHQALNLRVDLGELRLARMMITRTMSPKELITMMFTNRRIRIKKVKRKRENVGQNLVMIMEMKFKNQKLERKRDRRIQINQILQKIKKSLKNRNQLKI